MTTIVETPTRQSGSAAKTAALWAGLLIAGHLPLLIRFGAEQWIRPQYQFFPLMLPAAGYLAWQRLSTVASWAPAPRACKGGMLLMLLSLAMFAAASVLWSGRLGAASALTGLAGVALYQGGWAVLRSLVPAGVLLLICVGLPSRIDGPFLQYLRELAVRASSGVLIQLDLPHWVSGTVLEIPGARLLVAEACSGINSLIAVLGFTFALIFLRHRSPAAGGVLLVSSILIVLWANIARIVLGAWLKAHYGVDILSGAVHEWASILLFCLCMAIVMSTDAAISLVRRIRRPMRRRSQEEPSFDDEAMALAVPTPVISRGLWVVGGLFVVMGLAQVGNAAVSGGIPYWLWGSSRSTLPSGVAILLPKEMAGWQRSEQDEKYIAQPELEGKRSQTWVYRNGSIVAVIAADFPFEGYHDLEICYRNAGWNISRYDRRQEAERGNSEYASSELTRLNEHGYFWYSLLNERGQWVALHRPSALQKIQYRLQNAGRPDWNACTYQIQIWIQGYEQLTPQQQEQSQALFLAARAAYAEQLLQQLGGGR